jgi:hypothetical protein
VYIYFWIIIIRVHARYFPPQWIKKKKHPEYRRDKLALQTISILLGNSRKANIYTERRRDREHNNNVYRRQGGRTGDVGCIVQWSSSSSSSSSIIILYTYSNAGVSFCRVRRVKFIKSLPELIDWTSEPPPFPGMLPNIKTAQKEAA